MFFSVQKSSLHKTKCKVYYFGNWCAVFTGKEVEERRECEMKTVIKLN